MLLLKEEVTDPVKLEVATAAAAGKPRLVFLWVGAPADMAEYARSLGVKYAGFGDAADLAHIIAVPYRVVFSSILSRFAQVAVNGYRVVASRQPVVTTGIVSRWRGRMLMFRSLTADDFPLLFDWLQRPHVKEWWDDGEDTLYT